MPVRKLPSGKFQSQIRRVGMPTLSRTFTTKKKADEWDTLQIAKIINGEIQDQLDDISVLTLREAIEKYLKDVTPSKKGERQETNRGNYLLTLSYAQDMLETRLHRLSGDQVRTFRDERLEDVGNDAVRLELALISVVFNHAKKEWGIKLLETVQNPVSLVTKPKSPRGRDRRLNPDEEPYLLSALTKAKNPEARAAVLIAIETAMRKGENLAIEWSRIDLEHGTIKLYDTKNGKDRVVPLSGPAIEALEALPRTDKQVFHYGEWGIYKAWYNALKHARKAYTDDCAQQGKVPDAGFLKNLRIHDLRHEATTRLFETHDLSVMEASSVTGHTDPKMLARYTHLNTARDISKKMRGKTKESVPAADEDTVSKLERLVAIYEKGLLTEDEFSQQKAKLLA